MSDMHLLERLADGPDEGLPIGSADDITSARASGLVTVSDGFVSITGVGLRALAMARAGKHADEATDELCRAAMRYATAAEPGETLGSLRGKLMYAAREFVRAERALSDIIRTG